ncbi:MAG: hypothetical protein J6X02_03010 [Bacilli bacterium]|nr:hypothetical protein [Bacilli bacterium]
MNSAQIISIMTSYSSEYNHYSQLAKQTGMNYHDRIYYCGLAITTLQNIKDLANQYPSVIRTMAPGIVPDYSDVSFNNLVSLQSRIYHDQLVELRKNIRNGTYRLRDEMALKRERARMASAVANNSTNTNVSQAALEERNKARLSMAGTALKYPLHAVSRIIQGASRLVGNVLTLPAHIITYPLHMIISPDRQYTGHAVQELGDQIGNIISSGVRLIDNGIMRL